MRKFIERFRVGSENKCLLSSLQCVIISGSVSRSVLIMKAVYQVFYIYICPENPENLVGKATLMYSEQNKFVILNF